MADLAGIKAIFSSPTPKLVLATFRPSLGEDEAIANNIKNVKDLIKNASKQNNVELHEWTLPLAPKNGTPSTSPSAQIFQQVLGVANVHTEQPSVVPALLALNKGELVDVLKGIDAINQKAVEFIKKFSDFVKKNGNQSSSKSLSPQQKVGVFAVNPEQPTAATVDVAKMVEMGKDMMRKGQAIYAEKFFTKALGVLDAVRTQIDSSEGSDSDMEGSVAMTLAWLVMSQLVQERPPVLVNDDASNSNNNNGEAKNDAASTEGDEKKKTTKVIAPARHHAHNNAACDRLEKEFAVWITPLSDCSRAVTLRNLAKYLPSGAEWDGFNCSVKKITSELLEISAPPAQKTKSGSTEDKKSDLNPNSESDKKENNAPIADRVSILRSLLVITFFLQGDMERAITEAIKLHVLKNSYGSVAMDEMVKFLGEDHELVRRSGWLAIKGAGL